MRLITGAYVAALIAISMPAIAADKTDILVFVNGDRLTGEVKSLERRVIKTFRSRQQRVSATWATCPLRLMKE